ncbi:RES family NAD+ phosphorylase [Ralstonia pseudosolanacearum]|uniref:RES family NAD+ phosphorylase n=1 Tax=Ralstonia pseudosolanacearum TaxID=1310165 RepID=UPI0026FED823|nr:RES family NAD+ phosphorylase [Ralstonia pseudosolanacearum]MDO3615383.1 RES family NAD+ phosphorylase [Ralstonia pseudosolanacearum]
MTVALWRIATDTRDYTADDLTGEGAKRSGGRWNRPGLPVVYAASNIALACLETIVHLSGGDLPLNRYLVRVDVPNELWQGARALSAKTAPVGWDAIPAGKVSLDLGGRWLAEHDAPALLCVPSVIVPEEVNVLINPVHPEAQHIKATKLRRWNYDARVWA